MEAIITIVCMFIFAAAMGWQAVAYLREEDEPWVKPRWRDGSWEDNDG